jgi:hypothetical protein
MTSGCRELIGFFSCSFEDSDLARKLRNRIEHELGHRTKDARFWRSDEVSLIDRDAISQAIATSDFFIPLISPSFVNTAHCQSELDWFFENDPDGGRIFPIVCGYPDGEAREFLPERLKHHQPYDLSSVAHSSPDGAVMIQRLSEDIIKAVNCTQESEEQRSQQIQDAASFSSPTGVVGKAEHLTAGTLAHPAAKNATVEEIVNAQESQRRWAYAWQRINGKERRLVDRLEQLQARARALEYRVKDEIVRLAEETHRLEAERHSVAVEKKRLELERPTVELDILEVPSVADRRGAA